MNGRMYDANLGRFLSPDNFIQDPYNTQSFNRYGYVWNNPLKFNDPSGEFLVTALVVGAILGAATGAATYIGSAIKTGNWNWGEFATSVLGGAVIGALTAGQLPALVTTGYVAGTVAGGFVAGLLPSLNFKVGDFNFSVSPAIAFGNAGGIGANFSVGYTDGDFSVSAGVGITKFSRAHGTGTSTFESRFSGSVGYDDGKFRASLSSTTFRNGKTSQRVGAVSVGHGDWNFTYNNDGAPFNGSLGDGGDSYRTAAGQLSYKEYSAGFNLFTGLRNQKSYDQENDRHSKAFRDQYCKKFRHDKVIEQGPKYRLGAAYVGYRRFRAGTNAENVRHAIQNVVAHHVLKPQPGFENTAWNDRRGYFQYQSPNSYSLW